jgi:hypothetical protein
LYDVLHAQLAAAYVDHFGAPPGDHADLDAGPIELADAIAVADVEYLQRLTARPKVQSPVSHDTVDVQNEKLNGIGGGWTCHENAGQIDASSGYSDHASAE